MIVSIPIDHCRRNIQMVSRVEQQLATLLGTILVDLPNGATIANSEQLQQALSSLEYFVPEILRELHPEWKHESLDGIIPLVARKTNAGEAEIFGDCILISDQTLTPLHLRIQVTPVGDGISWIELRLGELSQNGMVRAPYVSASTTAKRLHRLEQGPDAIEWVYQVTFGARRI
jgi:hypothetical protein